MRILIASESPTIASLMRDASRIGTELQAQGHEIVYAMADPVAFAEQEPSSAPKSVVPVPLLREPAELILKRRPAAGFDDAMAISGFANAVHLQALCRAWSKQLQLVRPDAIIGFAAPLLWLVGPVFAPSFAAGAGDNLPPLIGTGFPRLSAMAAPLAADHVMVANANLVLAELGARPIEQLNEVVSRCGQLLYGLPWLDPHLQLRPQKSLGMLAKPGSPGPVPRKKRLAAFLDVFSPNIEAWLLSMAGCDEVDSEIFLIGATAGMRRFLKQQSNVKVVDDFSELAAHLPEMTGVIHHGDADIAELALAAGISQFVLPFMPHQQTLVTNFEWMGSVAKATPSDAIVKNAEMINWFAGNASLVVHARHHARQLHSTDIAAALPPIIEQIESAAALPKFTRDAAGAASSL